LTTSPGTSGRGGRTDGADRRSDSVPAHPADEASGLGVAAVARRLGVAPATLRSWHRRYGIGPSAHVDGRHRRYDAGDLDRLQRMQDALVHGLSVADAARRALEVDDSAPPVASGAPDGAGREVDAAEGSTGVAAGGSTDAAGVGTAGRVGGRGLRLPGAGQSARGLARAVLALDQPATREVLAEAVRALGVIRMWDEVARPVLVALADRWAETGAGVEVEHLLSESLVRVVHDAGSTGPPALSPRPVLLACVPGEAHSLPLSVLAAAASQRGIASRLLGAALPEPALRSAVRRIAPAAVVLWAQGPGPHLGALLADPPRLRPRCRWFVGGPGWAEQDLPDAIGRLDSLAAATDALESSALGAVRPARPA
jgi:DNA-binding transcriptional MerR regulator